MKKLIIFGLSELAEVAWFYFLHDSNYKISAFTVNQEYITSDSFHGIPVIPFENIETSYSPQEYDLFIATGYGNLNQDRAAKYIETKLKGYNCPSYISSKATTWPGLVTGDNCFILENNTIQPFVKIGNNTTLWSGNHIGHHVEILDNVFIASQVVISGGVRIESNCFIGVNATIRDHIVVAENSIIGAGALILKDTNSNCLYKGIKSSQSQLSTSAIERIL